MEIENFHKNIFYGSTKLWTLEDYPYSCNSYRNRLINKIYIDNVKRYLVFAVVIADSLR